MSVTANINNAFRLQRDTLVGMRPNSLVCSSLSHSTDIIFISPYDYDQRKAAVEQSDLNHMENSNGLDIRQSGYQPHRRLPVPRFLFVLHCNRAPISGPFRDIWP